MNGMPTPEYLGITEAADYLRVSASTLRRWEKKGFLVPERTPTGIRRYTKSQLDDVIQTPPNSPSVYSQSYSSSQTVNEEEPLTAVHGYAAAPVSLEPSYINQAQIDEIDDSHIGLQRDIDQVVESIPDSLTIEEQTLEESPHSDLVLSEYSHYSPNVSTPHEEIDLHQADHVTIEETPIQRPSENVAATETPQKAPPSGTFFHYYHPEDSDVEDSQDLEEYDSDAAYSDPGEVVTEDRHIAKEEGMLSKLHPQLFWVIGGIGLFVFIFVAILLYILFAPASELLSPLAV